MARFPPDCVSPGCLCPRVKTRRVAGEAPPRAARVASSQVKPGVLSKDPENRLLSRGPRFRLDAEMLRDQALSVSGLLRGEIGGPSVKPPQPDGLWYAVAITGSNTARFVKDEGVEKVHRRSLYTFW